MRACLTFIDSDQEHLYLEYMKEAEFNLFRRLALTLIMGSFSGTIYNIIIGEYLYCVLGTWMFFQTIIALYLARKSPMWLIYVACIYQLEIQTLLTALIILLDSGLNNAEILMITSSAYNVSVSLSIGSKIVPKLAIIIYTGVIQVALGNYKEGVSLTWNGFCFFSMMFAIQVVYFQERDKRQKYLLHKNAELIENNLINQIKIPIFKCRNNDERVKVEFIAANNYAQSHLTLTDQDTFTSFIRAAEFSTDVTKSQYTQRSLHPKNQTLESLIRNFFKTSEQKTQRNIYMADINQNQQLIDKYTYSCMIVHKREEYKCQLIILNDQSPYCLVILQRDKHQLIQQLQSKHDMIDYQFQQLMKISEINITRCQQLIFEKANTKIECAYRYQKIMTQIQGYRLFHCKLPKELIKRIDPMVLIKSILYQFKYILKQRRIQISMNLVPNINTQKIQFYQLLLNLVKYSIEKCMKTISIVFNTQYDPLIQKSICSIQITIDIDSRQRDDQLEIILANKIVANLGPYNEIEFRQDMFSHTLIAKIFV